MEIKAYLKYRLNRVDAHGIHSPFVFELYNEVILKAKWVDDAKIQTVRQSLKNDERIIEVEDFGAGSRTKNGSKRKISTIAKSAAVNRKFGKLLARLVEFYKLENAIELGTSLGIGTSYIASQPSIKKIITIEGSPQIAQIAKQNFEELKLKNINMLIGKFDDHLKNSVAEFSKIDLIYLDGNHQYQSTVDYFNFYIEHAHDNTFLIFDDIYWSEGMKKAWEEISASPKINVSIDLFRMGIVCKKSTQAKQHFVLKY